MHIPPWVIIIGLIFFVLLIIYAVMYRYFSARVEKEEKILLDIFIRKAGKIPGIIEVMRPYVASEKAFDSITKLHTDILVGNYESIYDMLEDNGKLQNDFLFLMELSQKIRFLQKDEYFLYMRDFIIEYERDMRKRFENMNNAIRNWNGFIRWKNMSIIGLLLPGMDRSEIF